MKKWTRFVRCSTLGRAAESGRLLEASGGPGRSDPLHTLEGKTGKKDVVVTLTKNLECVCLIKLFGRRYDKN